MSLGGKGGGEGGGVTLYFLRACGLINEGHGFLIVYISNTDCGNFGLR